MEIQQQIRHELEQARAARLAGNEGRARVCARRAAGIAARDFLTRNRVPLRSPSAIDALRALAEFPGLPADLLPAAAHLTMRVTEEFAFPVDADLIADARLLCGRLLQD